MHTELDRWCDERSSVVCILWLLLGLYVLLVEHRTGISIISMLQILFWSKYTACLFLLTDALVQIIKGYLNNSLTEYSYISTQSEFHPSKFVLLQSEWHDEHQCRYQWEIVHKRCYYWGTLSSRNWCLWFLINFLYGFKIPLSNYCRDHC